MSTLAAIPRPAEASATNDVVVGRALAKRYGEGDAAVDALRSVDVGFAPGTFTAIMGPSGSGKSTLLHILAGLDQPTSGWVEIAGTRLDTLGDRALTLLRRSRVGFVFQSYNLLPVLTAEENLLLPLRIAGERADPTWVETLIESVSRAGAPTGRPSSPAASSSGSPSLARWSPGRRSSSPTSRRAISTRPPGGTCSSCYGAPSTSSARRSSWSPTTRPPPRPPTASSSWRTARWWTSAPA
jgi:putative ABC transport system ATP-binding protein